MTNLTDTERFDYAVAFLLSEIAAHTRSNLADVDLSDDDETAVIEIAQKLTINVAYKEETE